MQHGTKQCKVSSSTKLTLSDRRKNMYIIDGIAYAGELQKPVTARSVRPLKDHRLIITFDSGEKRIFDFTPLLDMPCYKPLCDPELFSRVYVEYGTAVWNDGEIDIAPETLYSESIKFTEDEPA